MILTFKFRCTGNYGDLLHSFIELKIFFFMTSQRLFANRNHGIPKKPIWVFNFIENQNRIILIKNILKHDLQMKTFMIHDNFFFFFWATLTATLDQSWTWIRSIHCHHTAKHKSPWIKNLPYTHKSPITNRLFNILKNHSFRQLRLVQWIHDSLWW